MNNFAMMFKRKNSSILVWMLPHNTYIKRFIYTYEIAKNVRNRKHQMIFIDFLLNSDFE